MEIIKGLNLPADENGRVQIPDCKRRDLPKFFKEMGYKVGVEIGVYFGQFTKFLLNDDMRVYAIDPWLAYEDYHPGKVNYQKRQNMIYENAKIRLKDYPNCKIIRKTSMEALKDFEDESIDFVYIDGHHGFKYVTEDIYEWSKKVRKGGIISGHDYTVSPYKDNDPFVLQVQYVIDAYTKAFQIKKWYVLGSLDFVEGEARDRCRSWMWIK